MTETYQNWVWHILYHLERRNAKKDKIIGMVTMDELINYIQEIEKVEWEQVTPFEKEYGGITPPHSRVQIQNSLRGLKNRKLIKEYSNKEGTKCIQTI